MISMLRIAVLGGRDTVMGFKALGLDVFPAAGPEEAKDIFRRLTRESEGEYAIIYVEENLAQHLEHEIARYKDVPSPAIILIPGREGPLGLGQSALKAAVEKGVAALSKIQGADGGFSTGGAETCESNAQVLVALAELGISLDDSRFVKNGNTALDALLTYANADGSFRHTMDGDANEMATEQALYALAAAKLAESGKSLYKMDAPKADTQSGTFRDVVGHKNQKAIEALAEKGVINGMTADTFAPDAGLTRAQFCAIVVRALGLSQEKTAEFTDVLQTDWFCGFVGAASKAGIVNGVGNGKFNPQGAITREQAATMLARASKTLGLSGEAKDADAALKMYPDAQAASSYAKDALAFCAEHNILESDRTELRPGEAICRCEVAQMVWNLLAAAREV